MSARRGITEGSAQLNHSGLDTTIRIDTAYRKIYVKYGNTRIRDPPYRKGLNTKMIKNISFLMRSGTNVRNRFS